MRREGGRRATFTSGGAGINDPLQSLLSSAAFYALLAGLTVGVFWIGVSFARGLGRGASYSLAGLGLSRPRGGFLAGVGVGMAVGIGGVISSMILNPLSVFVLDRLGYPTESTVQQPFMRGLQSWVGESPGLAIPTIILVVVVLGPTVEELVFRGAVFNGLRKLGGLVSGRFAGAKGDEKGATAARVSFALSALASSAAFALLHREPVLLPALLLLAIVLCYLFEKTESLLPPIVAHATFNSFATSIIILSGLGVFELPI